MWWTEQQPHTAVHISRHQQDHIVLQLKLQWLSTARSNAPWCTGSERTSEQPAGSSNSRTQNTLPGPDDAGKQAYPVYET